MITNQYLLEHELTLKLSIMRNHAKIQPSSRIMWKTTKPTKTM